MYTNYNRVIKIIAVLCSMLHIHVAAESTAKKIEATGKKIKPASDTKVIKGTKSGTKLEPEPEQEPIDKSIPEPEPEPEEKLEDIYKDKTLPFGLHNDMNDAPEDVVKSISVIRDIIKRHSLTTVKANSMILNFLNQHREMAFRGLIPKDLMSKISEVMSNQNQNISEEETKELREQIQDAFRSNMNKYPELVELEITLLECLDYLLKLPQLDLDYGNSYYYCRMNRSSNKKLKANLTRVCTWIVTILSKRLEEYVSKINPDANPQEGSMSLENHNEANPNEE